MMFASGRRPVVIFRADAGEEIGLGHVVRCLSLARALQNEKVNCLFVSSSGVPRQLVIEKGFEFIDLHSSHKDPTAELEALIRTIQRCAPVFVVVDGYFVTESYLKAVRECCPVVYLDDIKAFAYPSDVLVNYNVYGPDWKQDYIKNQASFGTKLLLGPRYAPLREEFENLPGHQTAERVQRVLLSTGGSDSLGIMCRLLKAIGAMPEWSGIEFHAVVGALNPYREQIEQMACGMGNVRVHFQLRQVADLMCRCDVAVSAAGSTLYELCACGVPTVTYVLADNQIPGARAFDRQGLIMMAGDCRELGTEKKIISQLKRLIADAELRKQTSRQMQQAVDGKGAWRLAQALLSFAKAE